MLLSNNTNTNNNNNNNRGSITFRNSLTSGMKLKDQIRGSNNNKSTIMSMSQ